MGGGIEVLDPDCLLDGKCGWHTGRLVDWNELPGADAFPEADRNSEGDQCVPNVTDVGEVRVVRTGRAKSESP